MTPMGTHILAQVVLPYYTGVPEDVAVNTFHFDAMDADVLGDPSLVTEPLKDFYRAPVAPSTSAPGEWLSPIISRGVGAAKVKLYDMSEPKPRRPFEVDTFTLPTVIGATDGMPNECCIVSSFHGDPLSGHPQARRRGRIFFGPLTRSAFSMGTTSAMPAVGTVFRTSLVNASKQLCIDVRNNGPRWVVYSRASGDLVEIRSGWVDSDPDTQRRRENGVRDRVTWTLNV